MPLPAIPIGAAMLGGSLISAGFSAKQASDNRDFQRSMSNTSYQRAAKDLEKAGLNRVLALGGGASTPTGSMASAPDLGATIGSAYQARNLKTKQDQEVQTMKAQEGLLAGQTAKSVQEARLVDAQADRQEWDNKAADLLNPAVKKISDKSKELFEEGINSAKAANEAGDWWSSFKSFIPNWLRKKQAEYDQKHKRK